MIRPALFVLASAFSFTVVALSPSHFEQAATQLPEAQTGSDALTLSVGVRLVEVPVLVRASAGGMRVDNLQQSSFAVFEDDIAQEIRLFKHEDSPLSVGLILNANGTADRIQAIH